MMLEIFALWLTLCGVIALVAFKTHNLPIAMISSFGFMISGMKWYTEEGDLFVMAMLMALALVLPVSVTPDKRW